MSITDPQERIPTNPEVHLPEVTPADFSTGNEPMIRSMGAETAGLTKDMLRGEDRHQLLLHEIWSCNIKNNEDLWHHLVICSRRKQKESTVPVGTTCAQIAAAMTASGRPTWQMNDPTPPEFDPLCNMRYLTKQGYCVAALSVDRAKASPKGQIVEAMESAVRMFDAHWGEELERASDARLQIADEKLHDLLNLEKELIRIVTEKFRYFQAEDDAPKGTPAGLAAEFIPQILARFGYSVRHVRKGKWQAEDRNWGYAHDPSDNMLVIMDPEHQPE